MRTILRFILSTLLINTSQAWPIQSPKTVRPAAPLLDLAPQSPLMSSTENPSDLTLTDVLPSHPSISIFASLARTTSSLTSLLNSSPPSSSPSSPSTHLLNITILAPSNSALSSLPRKPWEQPSDYTAFGASAYEGADGEERAQRNREGFVRAHVVVGGLSISGGKEGEQGVKKARTLADTEVWVEEREGNGEGGKRRFVMPDGVQVQRVAEKVGDGEVWILDGVLNYDI